MYHSSKAVKEVPRTGIRPSLQQEWSPKKETNKWTVDYIHQEYQSLLGGSTFVIDPLFLYRRPKERIPLLESWLAIPSDMVQPVADIGFDLARLHRVKMMRGDNALAQLF